MPDEVNIDELLELENEEERSRKIQVGGRAQPVTLKKLKLNGSIKTSKTS